MTCQFFRFLVNTLDTNEKCPVLNGDNLTIPIQMQLSQKQKTFSEIFGGFPKSRLNSEYFEKKMTITAFVFPKLQTLKRCLDISLKSPVSEDHSGSNMEKVAKQC